MKPLWSIQKKVLSPIAIQTIVLMECLQTAAQRDLVLSAQAQAFFNDGRYFQAAQCFSQCSVTFDEVALKFLDAGERDALRSYLVSRLERTQKTVSLVQQPPRCH